jgi:hypothetical protein
MKDRTFINAILTPKCDENQASLVVSLPQATRWKTPRLFLINNYVCCCFIDRITGENVQTGYQAHNAEMTLAL